MIILLEILVILSSRFPQEKIVIAEFNFTAVS